MPWRRGLIGILQDPFWSIPLRRFYTKFGLKFLDLRFGYLSNLRIWLGLNGSGVTKAAALRLFVSPTGNDFWPRGFTSPNPWFSGPGAPSFFRGANFFPAPIGFKGPEELPRPGRGALICSVLVIILVICNLMFTSFPGALSSIILDLSKELVKMSLVTLTSVGSSSGLGALK